MLANFAVALASRQQLVAEPWLDMLAFGRAESTVALYEPLAAQLNALGIIVPAPENKSAGSGQGFRLEINS